MYVIGAARFIPKKSFLRFKIEQAYKEITPPPPINLQGTSFKADNPSIQNLFYTQNESGRAVLTNDVFNNSLMVECLFYYQYSNSQPTLIER